MEFKNLSVEEAAKAYYTMQLEAMKKAELDKVEAEKAAAEKAEIEDMEKQIKKCFNFNR